MTPQKVTTPIILYPILLGLCFVVPYTGSAFTISELIVRVLYLIFFGVLVYAMYICSRTRPFYILVRRIWKICKSVMTYCFNRIGSFLSSKATVMSELTISLQKSLSIRPAPKREHSSWLIGGSAKLPSMKSRFHSVKSRLLSVATPMRKECPEQDVEEGSPVCTAASSQSPSTAMTYRRGDTKRTSTSSNFSLPPRVGAPMKMKHSTYVKLDAELGRGASKTVWLALDLGSQQKVAWGVVHLAHTSKKEHDRAVSELALLMSNSPYRQKVEKKRFEKNSLEEGQKYLVRLLDMVSTETHLHIITELIKGGNLRRWSQTTGFYPDGRPCTEKDAKNLMKVVTDISHGLAWLHHRNIIHRDVRPENILINTDSTATRIENAVLADMGLFAFSPSVLSEKISIAGRDEYLAPEIVKQMIFDDTAMGVFDVTFSANYSDKVDVWMLGLSIAEIPSNKLPCVNIHRCNSFEQYTEALSYRIREYTDKLNLGDHELITFFDNALRIHPDVRWSSLKCWKIGEHLCSDDDSMSSGARLSRWRIHIIR